MLLRSLGRIYSRAPRRGFTLVELMVVVMIVAILAVIAVPMVAQRMRDRRTLQAAHEVSSLYRDARMRAMGRGSAVLVRYDGKAFEVREAVRGTDDPAGCRRLPISSCLSPAWESPPTTSNQRVRSLDFGEVEGLKLEISAFKGDDAEVAPFMDVCFTPMGRTWVRYEENGTWDVLASVAEATIWREANSERIGLTRSVVIPPNGNARLGVSRAE